MTLAKFALLTHDLNAIKSLEGYESYWDLNPKKIDDEYKLVFLYLDSEENLKKSLIDQVGLSGLKEKLIGIYLSDRNVLPWLHLYPSVNGSLNLHQLKTILNNQHRNPSYDGIFLKVKNRLEKIKFNQIRWIMAKDVYSIIKTEDARFLVSHTLKEMEEKLIPYTNFKRIHRSYLVNLDFVEAIEEGELIIDSEAIPIGPAYKQELMTRLLFM